MDSDVSLSPRDIVKCPDCDCDCSLVASSSDPWTRSVKRKYQELKERSRLPLPCIDLYSNAKLLAEDECIALRESLCSQRKTVENLYVELEEERNAASSAVNETMSMIFRLQREKAEIQMEARQFKALVEEKMSHDQEELAALEELLYEKEQAIEALTYEVEACRHRMLSYGFTEAEIQTERLGLIGFDAQYDVYTHDYPSMNCRKMIASEDNVESPSGEDHLKCLERRISQLECDRDDVIEKVMIGQSPKWRGHVHKLSIDSYCSNSPLGTAREIKETIFMDSPRSTKKSADSTSEEMSDRVYTIDAVHIGVSEIDIHETKKTVARLLGDYSNSPRYQQSLVDQRGISDPDIEKLYKRLQALEADKESLRQVILSMRTDKAQLAMLKEIAQHLSNEMSSNRRMPMRKMSFLGAFSIVTVFKWITSIVSWKRRARQKKYVYQVSANNMSLLMLLDKGSGTRRWRCLTGTNVSRTS